MSNSQDIEDFTVLIDRTPQAAHQRRAVAMRGKIGEIRFPADEAVGLVMKTRNRDACHVLDPNLSARAAFPERTRYSVLPSSARLRQASLRGTTSDLG